MIFCSNIVSHIDRKSMSNPAFCVFNGRWVLTKNGACELCCECGTPWGPGQTWKTSYRIQSRELWYGTSCLPRCQRLKLFFFPFFSITPKVYFLPFYPFRCNVVDYSVSFVLSCVSSVEYVDYAHLSRLKKGEWRNWFCGGRSSTTETDRIQVSHKNGGNNASELQWGGSLYLSSVLCVSVFNTHLGIQGAPFTIDFQVCVCVSRRDKVSKMDRVFKVS